MAGKTMNTFVYKGERYTIIGVSGDRLPCPQDFGIDLSSLPNAEEGYGYTSRFSERDAHLVLVQVLFNCLGPCAMDEAMMLNDVKLAPVQHSDLYQDAGIDLPEGFTDQVFGAWYNGVDLEVEFSGGILLGGALLADGTRPLDPKYPFAYHPVIELIFEAGELIETADHSEKMLAWRTARKEQDDLRAQKRKELGAEQGMKFHFSEEIWDEAYRLHPRVEQRESWKFIREYED